jgi:two-component system chemotaxis response regulator CheY
MALNILIVDDSVTVRAVITKTLQIAEVPVNQIYEAENGQVALEVLKNNWIDLVFADINMPVMTGVEMIEGSATRIDALKEKGISAYIRKPFTPEVLKEVIERVTGVTNE